MNKTLPHRTHHCAQQSAVYVLRLVEIQVFKALMVEGTDWFLTSICLIEPTRANLFLRNF